jgi:hypothetical protein
LKKGLAAAPEVSIGTGTASAGGRKLMQPRAQVHDQEEGYHDGALAAFMARKLKIDTILQRLTELSANHFDVDPEDVDWGHVGTLGHYHQLLRQVCDRAFHEGEHAA